jgi:hypothetical protein
MILTEAAITKIENLANQAIEIPLAPTNSILDKGSNILKKNQITKKILKAIEQDPSKISKEQNAKEWAGLMGAGSLISHAPQILSGDIATPLALATGNAAKGAVIGPMLTGSPDTLLKSTMIPAGVVAITTPLLNAAGESLDLGDNIDFAPEARAGLTGSVGAGMWAFRNRKNKNRQYI